jgi:hypothetical protein
MRPESLSPLTLEEHRQLGEEIKAMSGRMHELARVVASVYGPNNQAAFGFLQLVEVVDRLQKDLQSQAEKDLPGYPVNGFYS